ncbi:hypothetical protein C8J57DRAFT_1282746 [Mycena rebaudengoi]|nr:hypothetical protein C8J57DRAFT_1282746 [Mycena rebaudengoi]
MSTPPRNPILDLFSTSDRNAYHVPHLQENVLAACDEITQLALAHTCVLYYGFYEALFLKSLTTCGIQLDVRDPTVVVVQHATAKLITTSDPYYSKTSSAKYRVEYHYVPATEKELATVIHKGTVFRCYAFELWERPLYIPEPVWATEDLSRYKGVVTPGGIVLSSCFSVYDSMFGGGYVETWEIPASSANDKTGFTLADFRDLYSGRYKASKTGGSPEKRYSKVCLFVCAATFFPS